MKKVLLSAFALAAGMTAFAQGITEKAVYDDFMQASADADQYTAVTTEKQWDGAACTTDDAYKGIFTYADQGTDNNSGFYFTQTRDMSNGQLVLDYFQDYGEYEPFGIVFGSYCDNSAEGKFTLDLSANAEVSFNVSLNDVYSVDTTGGIQMKLQMTDINGVSLVFDKGSVEADAKGAYVYELGIAGGGTVGELPGGVRPDGNASHDANYFLPGDGVIAYAFDFANAVPGNDASDAPDESKTFDYSQVAELKITFASNNKNAADNSYDPYPSKIQAVISELKIGDVDGEGLVSGLFDFGTAANDFTVYPNPSSSSVTFGSALTNAVVYNAQGAVVANFARVEAMDVSSLEAGVYMIKSAEGSAKFVVK